MIKQQIELAVLTELQEYLVKQFKNSELDFVIDDWIEKRFDGENMVESKDIVKDNKVRQKRKLVLKCHDNKRFGGNQESVWKRDSYRCVLCAMTQEEHRGKYGKRLSIHHLDNNGRNSLDPNNHIDNLATLCLKCHGSLDWNRKYNNDNFIKMDTIIREVIVVNNKTLDR